VLLLALFLRLEGIHNPVLDRPGWRQGDTAAIARNFAVLQYNVFYPQTSYDGPPPNYVELELQIVPFLAATLYKLAGVHEVFGRLITLAFSLGTVAVIGAFARWLFAGSVAGVFAALLYAVMPGSIYYGRTFTPDATMVFFLAAALYAAARLFVEEEVWKAPAIVRVTALFALAYLAKPVAVVALVPLAALLIDRVRAGRTLSLPGAALIFALPLIVLWGYDAFVTSHAEWHWTSGITAHHVLPSLRDSLSGAHALSMKLAQFKAILSMLARTMIGPAITAIAILGFAFMPAATRSRSLLWGWLIGGLAYTYVVVTVERVDYYMMLLLPLAALSGGGFLERLCTAVARSGAARAVKAALAAAGILALAGTTDQNLAIIKPYYHFSKIVYHRATALNATLPRQALIVMGHYDPSVLYYIGRYGWEEDPYLWTPFDEESAIQKGARYFIAIERNRFNRNVELCAWMQRFPVLDPAAAWPVFHTDPAFVKRGAEAQWRSFRNAERVGGARAWLDAHRLCALSP